MLLGNPPSVFVDGKFGLSKDFSFGEMPLLVGRPIAEA